MMENKQEYFTMTQLLNKASRFKNYSEALYATNVTFQQFNRAKG